MTSIGSNVGSSSRTDGPSAHVVWVSLTLEEQLTNIKCIFCKMTKSQFDATIYEDIARVVEQFRIDLWADIKNISWHHRFAEWILCGTTPLHWAVLMDDSTMVHFILTSGKVDINALTTYSKRTTLIYAIIGGNQDIVEDLLKHEADVCIVEFSLKSALYHMVRKKGFMFGILKTILASNVNICDDQGNTTLHYATKENATDIVAYLIYQKADVNLKNKDEETPLHIAVKNGSINVVECLLLQNVDVNAQDVNGLSPVHYARKNGNSDIISLLMNPNVNVGALDKGGITPLLFFIKKGRINVVKELIAHGVDVHIVDDDKNNALHIAIMAYGKEDNLLDIVKLLRESDVDANAKNSKEYTPFFAAVARGQTEMVKELLQSKEKIKPMEECNGQTAIQIAYDHGHEHIKRVLLERDDVSRYVDDLYRDRQVYVDAANAILVGAALIASVTFASWLQPPLGYTTPYLDLAPSSVDVNYVDVQHNAALRAFWIFNTLSFYFSIGTVVFGARSVLPRRRMFIKAIVVKLHRNLMVTSILLACSVFFVIIAFGIAGCIVLIPTLKFQWYMIVPTMFGGVVCLVSLGFLFKSMWEVNLEKKRKKIDLF